MRSPLSKKQRKKRNNIHKPLMDINSEARFVRVGCGGKKTFIIAKNRRRVLPKRNILECNNIW